jgi:hypothetical protein
MSCNQFAVAALKLRLGDIRSDADNFLIDFFAASYYITLITTHNAVSMLPP